MTESQQELNKSFDNNITQLTAIIEEQTKSLQSVIDVEAGRIHDALNSVLRDDSKVPLPASFHRPPTAGKNYASSQLLDILTPSNIKPNNSEAINHKELYYDSMKYSLGHAPNGAKELKKTSGHHHHHCGGRAGV